MSTKFVRQYISEYPNLYTKYIDFASNVECTIEDNLVDSNKSPVTMWFDYLNLKFGIMLENENIKKIVINSDNQHTKEINCNFRYRGFIEILDTLIIMILSQDYLKHQQS